MEYEIEKDYDEDLGIVFESAVFDKVKALLDYQPLNEIEKNASKKIICDQEINIERKEGTE